MKAKKTKQTNRGEQDRDMVKLQLQKVEQVIKAIIGVCGGMDGMKLTNIIIILCKTAGAHLKMKLEISLKFTSHLCLFIFRHTPGYLNSQLACVCICVPI